MDLQHLKPDRTHTAPLYLQLYQRYRQAIATGKLRPGDRVPSVRSLASELNLARGTVELAYQMLVGEGYFIGQGAAGTRIAPGLTPQVEAKPASHVLSPAMAPTTTPNLEPPAFRLGLPALDAFPRKTWARLAARNQRNLGNQGLFAPPACGLLELRQAIATYLGISRGIACSHEQVFVTAGYRGALELVCRTLLHPGDLGWFEEPGYLYARQFLERAGMRLQPVPVDAQGLDVAHGQREAGDARFAVVTPTHQSPMGMALSLPRRQALLAWAAQAKAWVIEDDYDSEFRYHGRPLPALKSLDHDGRVLYTGTFSKVLFPGLRLAYLVVPGCQVERFRASAEHLPGPGSIVPQATTADFIGQGHFARHLSRMRGLYATRHHYLLQALDSQLGKRLHVQPQAGGLHVLAQLHGAPGDQALATAAQAEGLAVHALSDWSLRPGEHQGLLMGFANFTTAQQAQEAVRRLARVWGDI
ncbi:PLP-dependent aminotransferase family protein [Pseudomonas sp. NPDC089554]|uniref:MocR-like pyridoxine biosynthesis transcription factor PdxR n=1 Tax=Pseudomonas sp. NPDC089554 TaxID=3390653 RepID=UPI003D05BE4E